VGDRKYESRIRAAFDRYRSKPTEIPRVFDKGIPVVLELPIKHWVCFFLARTLGQIGDRRAVPVLLNIVSDLKNAPDTRHAAAEALGRIADPDSIERIRELAVGYPEVSTRRALVKACTYPGDLGTPAVVSERR
jgi:HEAT repeat protein